MLIKAGGRGNAGQGWYNGGDDGYDNVIRLPREWIGPLEDLIPVGSAADRAAESETTATLDARQLTRAGAPAGLDADAFWAGGTSAVQAVLRPRRRPAPPPRPRRTPASRRFTHDHRPRDARRARRCRTDRSCSATAGSPSAHRPPPGRDSPRTIARWRLLEASGGDRRRLALGPPERSGHSTWSASPSTQVPARVRASWSARARTTGASTTTIGDAGTGAGAGGTVSQHGQSDAGSAISETSANGSTGSSGTRRRDDVRR